ncbi:MAG: NAD-dependent epimerase/dehydratase family protein [Chloroflexi bacterium]|nr:NAD-dependent epimerase/dehydratase family protein [Chloroflexota bacterium]
MRFLITGGAGFLGTALANHLISIGHQVRVLDDLSAGDPNQLDERVLFTRGDVRDVPKLWTLLKGTDCVYHLAARVSVPESVLYPVDYNAVNVGGTVALMTAVRDAGVKRVILTSSGAAYGKQDQQPVREDALMHPDTPYAVSKLAAEYYLHSIGALWKIETVALRIFNAFGPRQPLPPSHAPVIPRFLKQVCAGGSVVVFGQGKQTRDFVYIADVVSALAHAATAERVNRAIINIGSGQEVSIAQLVDRIERAAGREAHRLVNAEEESGVSRLVADIQLANELLKWKPRVSLEDGLQRMLADDERFKR